MQDLEKFSEEHPDLKGHFATEAETSRAAEYLKSLGLSSIRNIRPGDSGYIQTLDEPLAVGKHFVIPDL